MYTEEAVEYAHKYSADKTADQMVALYRESPEYARVMEQVGVTDTGAQISVPLSDDEDGAGEHTYPISFAYVLLVSCFFY